ncbi:MAG: DNA-formamidopyrimidine glycosylase [Candidatus Hermodarchaeota archaeon]
MPELPEVETFKRYFDSTSLNKNINEIMVRDNRVLNVEENNFKIKIIGKTFNSSQRHGKYLFVDLNSIFLVFHFGMTGDFEYFSKIDEEPTHSRILFKFQNDDYLSYISQRMFGKVDLTEKVETFIKEKKLGPDAFNMTFQDFKSALKKRSAYAKSALMDQSIVAGIGNIYSDEILYQAKIHPKTKINKLDELKLKELFDIIKRVLKCGIEKKGELSTYPKNYIIPYRNKKGICPKCTGKIQRLEISGRHGFFCPSCQIQIN